MPRFKVGREEKVVLAILAALWLLVIVAVAYIMLGH